MLYEYLFSDDTSPVMHLEAPSSIHYGKADIVVCSMTANRVDPGLTMHLNGHVINPWDAADGKNRYYFKMSN